MKEKNNYRKKEKSERGHLPVSVWWELAEILVYIERQIAMKMVGIDFLGWRTSALRSGHQYHAVRIGMREK